MHARVSITGDQQNAGILALPEVSNDGNLQAGARYLYYYVFIFGLWPTRGLLRAFTVPTAAASAAAACII